MIPLLDDNDFLCVQPILVSLTASTVLLSKRNEGSVSVYFCMKRIFGCYMDLGLDVWDDISGVLATSYYRRASPQVGHFNLRVYERYICAALCWHHFLSFPELHTMCCLGSLFFFSPLFFFSFNGSLSIGQ